MEGCCREEIEQLSMREFYITLMELTVLKLLTDSPNIHTGHFVSLI